MIIACLCQLTSDRSRKLESIAITPSPHAAAAAPTMNVGVPTVAGSCSDAILLPLNTTAQYYTRSGTYCRQLLPGSC